MVWWGDWCSCSVGLPRSWDEEVEKRPALALLLTPNFPCPCAHAALGAGEPFLHCPTYITHSARCAASPVTGCALHRLLCSHQSANVAMSLDVPAVRKEFSLLGFTAGKWLLPWTGEKGNLEGAAIASCCPCASGGSCCIPGKTFLHHGNTRKVFLSSRQQCSTSVQPRSSQHGADSALHHHLAAHSWCGFGLPVQPEKRENAIQAARQPCAGMTGSRDKMTRIFFLSKIKL